MTKMYSKAKHLSAITALIKVLQSEENPDIKRINELKSEAQSIINSIK